MFNISPIGSCRINTPLRITQETYGFTVCKSRSYGFTHTSAEAVQQARFMLGLYEPQPQAWPLIARGRDSEELISSPYTDSDLYVIEISSLKKLTLGDDCIQLNYLSNEFKAFFSDKERSKAYWKVVSNSDQKVVDDFLAEHWDETDEQKAEQQTLRAIRLSLMTEDEIREDIKTLIELLPRVVFITHVNARKPNGEVIASRNTLIETVKKLANELGAYVYDPTNKMLEVGQEVAIEDHSDSLAHYTEEFGQLLVKDWFDEYIKAQLFDILASSDIEDFKSKAVAYFRALIKNNEQSYVVEQLNKLPLTSSSSELYQMKAQAYEECQQAELALDTLKNAVQEYPDDMTAIRSYFDAALAYGSADEALRMFELLSKQEEIISSELELKLINLAAEKEAVGSHFSLLVELYIRHPNCGDLASLLVDAALASNSDDKTIEIHAIKLMVPYVSPTKLLELAPSIFDELNDEEWLMIFDNHQLDTNLYISTFINENRFSLATQFLSYKEIPAVGNLTSLGRIDIELATAASDWLEKIASSENLKLKNQAISSFNKAFTNLREGVLTHKSFVKDILTKTRALYKQGSTDELLSLYQQIGNQDDLFELPFLTARTLFNDNRFEESLEVVSSALQLRPEHLLANVFAMRSAVKCEQFVTAYRAAERVIELNEPDSENLLNEARVNLSRIPQKATISFRNTEDLDEKYALLNIIEKEHSLKDKAEKFYKQLERVSVKKLIDMEKSEDFSPFDICSFAEDVHKRFGNIEKVLLVLARNWTKQKYFALAIPYWAALTVKYPANPNYHQQLERCQSNMGQ
ncbi:hypothetical protein [Pseudoalteromonas sp. MTN2-4]|uniref:hypothetical protein n=1 Tax=Pseudoalteromonas sp. MTN2-4 TaxID=3056555 RepID=UPI0036F1F8C7